MATISGKEVLDDDFNKERIKIAFNPYVEMYVMCQENIMLLSMLL